MKRSLHFSCVVRTINVDTRRKNEHVLYHNINEEQILDVVRNISRSFEIHEKER